MIADKRVSYAAAPRQIMPAIEHRLHKGSTTGPRTLSCRRWPSVLRLNDLCCPAWVSVACDGGTGGHRWRRQ
jgi:hypothetical protein